MNIKILPLLVLLHLNTLNAQQYIWPTSASTYMSSSFCEFREGHYHSAIDIKTWLREGYPCYAIEDGVIERIRISPFGYGKVLYLRLNDGNFAIYAHLQKFSDQLEKVIRNMQLNNQRYRLDWRPKNLNVKKGEIIAYTGSTGTGVPHLHFEIRNKKDNPINPLEYYSQVKDNIRPTLSNFAVIPISDNSSINGSYKPETFPLSHIKDGVYVIKKPLLVKGKVGVAINGFDQANDVSNKYGFRQTIMEIEGREVFKITYDELQFATTSHIYTEIHYPLWVEKNEIYHKLYLESINPLSFYQKYPTEDGTIQIEDKPISFTITVRDFHGNQSIVKGEFIPDLRESIVLESIEKKGEWAYIRFSSQPFQELHFFTGKESKSLIAVNNFEILEGKIGNPKQSILAKVHLQDSNNNLLQIAIKLHNEQKQQRLISLHSDVQSSPVKSPTIHYLGNKLILEIEDLYNSCALRVLPSGKRVSLQHLDNGTMQTWISGKDLDSKIQLQLSADSLDIWSKEIAIAKIFPKSNQTTSWFNSGLTLKTGINSILDTILVTATQTPADSFSKTLPIASQIFEIQPNNFPIFENMTLQIKTDSLPNWGKWSIFQIDGKDDPSFITTDIDSNNQILSAHINSLGKYVVAADTIPPKIEIVNPVTDKIYIKNPDIHIKMIDELSGIGHEKNISLQIDGLFVLPEWDPEEDVVRAIYDKPLNSGKHIFTVSVKDQAGNIKRQAVTFTIE